jgi:hypothetical protein
MDLVGAHLKVLRVLRVHVPAQAEAQDNAAILDEYRVQGQLAICKLSHMTSQLTHSYRTAHFSFISYCMGSLSLQRKRWTISSRDDVPTSEPHIAFFLAVIISTIEKEMALNMSLASARRRAGLPLQWKSDRGTGKPLTRAAITAGHTSGRRNGSRPTPTTPTIPARTAKRSSPQTGALLSSIIVASLCIVRCLLVLFF